MSALQLTTRLAIIVPVATLLFSSQAVGSSFPSSPSLFQTPSGNIVCVAERTSLRCDIRTGFKPIPPKAQLADSCTIGRAQGYGDWPPASVTMRATGRALVACPTDGGIAELTLGYGTTWRNASFSCVSKQSGLTCRNKSGFGFTLSRERSALLNPGGRGNAKVVIATETFEDLAKWLARPLSINLAMGVRNLISELHWSSWGGSDAKATGVTLSKACVPDCASSNSYTRTPTKVLVFGKRKCANGYTAYTRIRVTQGSSKPYVQSLLCP